MANKSTGKMTRSQLIFSAIGTGLGLGLVTYIGYQIAYAGKAAILAVVFCIILGIASTLPVINLSRRTAVAGGSYGLVSTGLGRSIAAIINYTTLISTCIYASNPLALTSYVVSLAPGMSNYSKFISLACALLCFALITSKVTDMGSAQKFFTGALLVGLLVFIALGFSYIAKNGTADGYGLLDYSHDATYNANGVSGILTAVGLCMSLPSLYYTMIYYGPIVEDPRKNLPVAMIVAACASVFFWISLVIIQCNVLPIETVAGQPLTVLAETLMPSWLAKLFVILGPIMAILTTYIGSMPSSMESADRMAAEGWLPKFLGKKNKVGRPWIIAAMFTLLPMIFVFLNVPILKVQSYVYLLASPMLLICDFSYCRLIRTAPTLFKQGKDSAVYLIECFIAVIVHLMVFILSARTAGWIAALIVVLLHVVLLLVCRKRVGNTQVSTDDVKLYLLDA